MKNILILGSKSESRRALLDNAKIPYQIASQNADETKCDWALPLQKVVESIAIFKMEHVVLPTGKEGDICFVLTADTLSQDCNGTIHGKPADRDDAIRMLRAAAAGRNSCGTAFCLDKKTYKNGAWQLEKRILQYIVAQYDFVIPENWILRYLALGHGDDAAGAIRIEEYGSQFLKSVDGSYTTIVGLPMFELRQALEEIGFF